MSFRRAALLLLAVTGLLAIIAGPFHPRADEVKEAEPAPVSEAELRTYIEVYRAMQSDHDLTIDEAIQPHHISLQDFRKIERRIQSESRLVERVREALLEQAKQQSVFAQSPTTPTPTHGSPGGRKQSP